MTLIINRYMCGVRRSHEAGKLARIVLFVMMCTLPSLGAVAQEERHQHERHRHMKYADVKNPIAMTPQSITEGSTLYKKYCVVCHGESGRGGIGPRLAGHDRIHGNTDGEMFYVITDGVPGTAMKGFEKELSEKSRWHLVNYIHNLSGGSRGQ